MKSMPRTDLFEAGDINISFLVFRSRSGSTLIGDRLSRHPDILVTPESELVRRLSVFFSGQTPEQDMDYAALSVYLQQEKKLRDWNFSWSELERRFRNHNVQNWSEALYVICQLYKDEKKIDAKTVIIKKNSWNYKNIDKLLAINADVKSIWVVRDPRAIYSSARKALHSQTRKPIARNIIRSSLGWLDYMQRLSDAEKQYPGRIIRIRYEDFLQDMNRELFSVWERVDVSVSNKKKLQREISKVSSSHLVMDATAHLHQNLSQEPQLGRIEGWKNELPVWRSKLINLICGRKMREFGYDI